MFQVSIVLLSLCCKTFLYQDSMRHSSSSQRSSISLINMVAATHLFSMQPERSIKGHETKSSHNSVFYKTCHFSLHWNLSKLSSAGIFAKTECEVEPHKDGDVTLFRRNLSSVVKLVSYKCWLHSNALYTVSAFCPLFLPTADPNKWLNPKVHYHVHNSLPIVPILSQINQVQTIPYYLS